MGSNVDGDLYQGGQSSERGFLEPGVVMDNGRKPANCCIRKGNLAPCRRDFVGAGGIIR